MQIHGLGLKYGIYEDYGNYTCGGYPGVYGIEELDAQTIADWGADYIKLDGCYMDPKKMDEGIDHFQNSYLNTYFIIKFNANNMLDIQFTL